MLIQDYLAQQHVPFRQIVHDTTFTARNLARSIHTDAASVAKTVVLDAEDRFVLAVLSADRSIDFERAAEVLGVHAVKLASETTCGMLFPESELGAMPPFGSQHGMMTMVDRRLCYEEDITFEADRHRAAIRMKFADFERLERPMIRDFTRTGL